MVTDGGVLLGREVPRIWTPPLRELTPQTSLGFEVVEFAESKDFLGMKLVPWEKWLFVHGLELHPDFIASDPDPLFRFDTVVVIVSRQNGKTECIKVKKLWRMFIDGARDTLATAQDLGNAEKTWRQAVDLVKSVPELARQIEHVDRTNGQKSLRLDNLAQYLVRAMTASPRGWSIDDLDLDELLRHRSWEAWAAAAPTTLARPRSQIWAWSSAGDAASVVLWHLRAAALAGAVGVDEEELRWFTEAVNLAGPAEVDGEDVDLGDSLALFEWSAHPRAGLNDRLARAQANPSLGYGFLTERKLAGLIRATPSQWVARQEYLCQWRPTANGGPFPEGAWDAGRDDSSMIDTGSPWVAVVDVAHDRLLAYVVVAGWRPDGHMHVELVARRAGMEWVPGWLAAWMPVRPWAAVAVQSSGAPASSLVDPLTAAKLPDPDLDVNLPLVPWGGSDLAKACGQLWDLVRLPDPDDPEDVGKIRLFHLPQPPLDLAATSAATRPFGDAWVIDRRRSPHDAAPLMAAAGAVWLLLQHKPVAASAYEDSDLLVV